MLDPGPDVAPESHILTAPSAHVGERFRLFLKAVVLGDVLRREICFTVTAGS